MILAADVVLAAPVRLTVTTPRRQGETFSGVHGSRGPGFEALCAVILVVAGLVLRARGASRAAVGAVGKAYLVLRQHSAGACCSV